VALLARFDVTVEADERITGLGMVELGGNPTQ